MPAFQHSKLTSNNIRCIILDQHDDIHESVIVVDMYVHDENIELVEVAAYLYGSLKTRKCLNQISAVLHESNINLNGSDID